MAPPSQDVFDVGTDDIGCGRYFINVLLSAIVPSCRQSTIVQPNLV